jgi:hypothetical protein
VLWWRDSPYVLREPSAVPGPDLPGGLEPVVLPQDPARRGQACARYASQLGFQFGGEAGLRAALAGLTEVLLAGPGARAVLDEALGPGVTGRRGANVDR